MKKLLVLLCLLPGLCHAQGLYLSQTQILFNGVPLGLFTNNWRTADVINLQNSGAYYTNIFAPNLASGTNDLFTIPSGYRFASALFHAGTTNQSGATFIPHMVTNGVYYSFLGSTSVTTNAVGNTSLTYIWDEAEKVSVKTSATGINMILSGLLFPTNAPARSIKILSPTTGVDTLYTVPSGTNAYTFQSAATSVTTALSLGINYYNGSGGSRTTTYYVIPGGGSADSTTIWRKGPLADNTSSSQGLPNPLPSGCVVSVQSDVTTSLQWMFMTVFEQAVP